MLETILISLALIALAFMGLGISIFFRHNGRFPETEIGRNRKMRELGITCAKCDEMKIWKDQKKKNPAEINPGDLKIDINHFPPLNGPLYPRI
jgi:hypothetical protein